MEDSPATPTPFQVDERLARLLNRHNRSLAGEGVPPQPRYSVFDPPTRTAEVSMLDLLRGKASIGQAPESLGASCNELRRKIVEIMVCVKDGDDHSHLTSSPLGHTVLKALQGRQAFYDHASASLAAVNRVFAPFAAKPYANQRDVRRRHDDAVAIAQAFTPLVAWLVTGELNDLNAEGVWIGTMPSLEHLKSIDAASLLGGLEVTDEEARPLVDALHSVMTLVHSLVQSLSTSVNQLILLYCQDLLVEAHVGNVEPTTMFPSGLLNLLVSLAHVHSHQEARIHNTRLQVGILTAGDAKSLVAAVLRAKNSDVTISPDEAQALLAMAMSRIPEKDANSGTKAFLDRGSCTLTWANTLGFLSQYDGTLTGFCERIAKPKPVQPNAWQ